MIRHLLQRNKLAGGEKQSSSFAFIFRLHLLLYSARLFFQRSDTLHDQGNDAVVVGLAFIL